MKERTQSARIVEALLRDSPAKDETLKGIMDHLVRKYPADTLVEVLAGCFSDFVVDRIQPPNQPTVAECKKLAEVDLLSFRLFRAITQ